MISPQVYMVGAGPGDPELLTVKALRLIQNAQVLVYDRLISKDILKLAPASCSHIYVGKSTDRHTLPQEDINKLLVKLAKSGQSVVRLKGGDPGIFGRVGEEALALTEHNISYQIVPGISAAQASASALGIALTHRDYAPKLTLISGHRMENRPFKLNQSELNDPNQTLVVYMGVSSASDLSTQLLAAGRKTDTPIAVIERVSSPEQRVFLTTLDDLSATMQRHQIKPPALIVVSEVVATCNQYAFESLISDMAAQNYG